MFIVTVGFFRFDSYNMHLYCLCLSFYVLRFYFFPRISTKLINMFLSDDEEHLMLNQFSFISAGKLKHLTTQEKSGAERAEEIGSNGEIKLDVELDDRD